MIQIKNGLVIDPASCCEQEMDLLIEDGLIAACDKPGSFSSKTEAEIIDARGMWVVPGLVDIHVHLREPGFEWKETIESAGRAALAGGYTSVCCMPNTSPVNHNAEVTQFILKRARECCGPHVLPIGSVSLGLKGEEMSPFSELREAGCVAFSDDGEPVWNAGLMRRALEWCRMLGVRICCHEEDKHLCAGGSMNESALSERLGLRGIPAMSEEVMIARDIELARATRGRVHICHISTARGVELVRRAKCDGIDITCEVTPHHLHLNEDAVRNYDTDAKMNPPLRLVEDQEALLQGLKDGTIDAIASDHAPHEEEKKKVEFGQAAFGIIGLQTNLPLTLELVHAGRLSRTRAIEAMTSGPARTLGLAGGSLRKGAAADITLIRPDFTWCFERDKILSLSRNSPFIGREFKGIADRVIVSGRILQRSRENGERA